MISELSLREQRSPGVVGLTQSSSPIIITGAGGWLGRITLKLLEETLGQDELDRRVHVFGSEAREQILPHGYKVKVQRLKNLLSFSSGPAFYFHFAFMTRDRLLGLDAREFISKNREISRILQFSMKRNGVAGLFVPSSGAVYKAGTRSLENDVIANPYGMLKIEDEQNFTAIASTFSAPLSLPRVFNLSGPYINKLSIYALASMIMDAAQNKPIAIRADKHVFRSYVQAEDVLRLAIEMLYAPKPNTSGAFDTAGECVVELSDLARRVSKVFGSSMSISRPPIDSSRPADVYTGDPTIMRRYTEIFGIHFRDLDQQIIDTARYLAAID